MPISDWTPSVAQVGAILRARTKDRNGTEIGTFDQNTRPTGVQAQEQIDIALGKVSPFYSEELPDSLAAPSKRLVALYTAGLIELSYFPEQVATGRSPYTQLKALYDEARAEWEEAYSKSDDTPEQGDIGGYDLAMFTFPVDHGGLVGWSTRF